MMSKLIIDAKVLMITVTRICNVSKLVASLKMRRTRNERSTLNEPSCVEEVWVKKKSTSEMKTTMKSKMFQ
jgi:hypothetical protein